SAADLTAVALPGVRGVACRRGEYAAVAEGRRAGRSDGRPRNAVDVDDACRGRRATVCIGDGDAEGYRAAAGRFECDLVRAGAAGDRAAGDRPCVRAAG